MPDNDEEDNKNLPHTAITSCSGYIYQGKIAVMHCLKLFAIIGEDAKNLSLEIESLDDFAIKNADGSYKSMHQVKAKKSDLFSNYKQAIKDQKKASTQHSGIEVYFHTAQVIKDLPDSFGDDYHPVELYKYQDHIDNEVTACGLDCVDQLNEHQAKKAYQKLGQSPYKYNDSSYLEKTRHRLEDIVIKHIIDVHHQVITNTKKGITDRNLAKKTIPLTCFYQFMTQDLNALVESEDYFHYLLLKDAGRYFHEHCLDNDLEDEKILLKLNSYLSTINSLNVEQLTFFIRAVLPHKKAGMKIIKEYKDNAFTDQDFKYGLLCVFEELTELSIYKEKDNSQLFRWFRNHKFYYPTAISIPATQVKKLCRDIIKSAIADDTNFLFESGSLVNQAIDKSSIYDVYVGPNSEDDTDQLSAYKINRFKQISLISLDKAKELLND
jgi:hypothetical protein